MEKITSGRSASTEYLVMVSEKWGYIIMRRWDTKMMHYASMYNSVTSTMQNDDNNNDDMRNKQRPIIPLL